MAPPDKTAVSPSWTWGSSARIVFDAGAGNTLVSNSAQLLQVSLPEPAVCSVYFQAELTTTDPNDRVRALIVNLNEGVGRVTTRRQVAYSLQPAINAPLEVTMPFVPLHALNVDVTVVIDHFSSPNPANVIAVECTMILSPLTRIPQEIQKLQFGMGLPGEADDLDDELRAELEADGPTAAQVMSEGRQQVDGSSPEVPDDDEEEGDDEPEPQVQRAPGWVLALIDALTERYGRKPTRPELVRAINRRRQRALRRDERAR